MKIVIAGGRGFIGSHLIPFFRERGDELVLLSRSPKSAEETFWDPEKGKLDPTVLEGNDVVINLCGESLFGRWNEKKKEAIRESRIQTTRFLCTSLASYNMLPRLYLNASAIGYYGSRPGVLLTEESKVGNDFLAQLCKDWEESATPLALKNVPTALCRFGIVLGQGGGALKYMEKIFQMGMGGTLGSGEQMMSWIAIDDLCLAIQYVIDHPELSGPVNFTAPHPVSNLEFAKILGERLHRPSVVPVPKFILSMALGEGAEMFLSSIYAVPQRLIENGFQFQFPDLASALKKYLPAKG